MRNSLYSGNNVTLPAPYALISGQVAQVGSIIGVAQGAAAISADVVLVRQGVFTLTKTAAQAWTFGQTLYWDNAARAVTTTVGSNKIIGAAFAAALAADTVGQVLLDGAIR
jgi:predicted RecA/RadA family phage recombinase